MSDKSNYIGAEFDESAFDDFDFPVSDNNPGSTTLSEKEMKRYQRQIILDKWGVDNQKKLKNTTAFIGGAGGSGSPLINQLALLGVGRLIICDFDEVELSNLNRQSLHDESRIGINKAVSAKMTVEKINPHIDVIVHTDMIGWDNAEELVGDADIIFDNVDDVETKFALSEVAVKKGIPHILSSMMDINAYAVIFYPPHAPCLHCLYDRKKMEEIAELKELTGHKKQPNPVSSPALFLSTGFACNEGLKILLDIGQPAYNKYFLFNQKGGPEIAATDGHLMITYPFSKHFKKISKEQGFDWNVGWRGNFVEELDITPDPNCPVCSKERK